MPSKRPLLTVSKILRWADAHHQRRGAWPAARSGRVKDALAETWLAVNTALHDGLRGLPGGDSLTQLLRRERGLPDRRHQLLRPRSRRKVARLRGQGLSLSEIGRRLGVSHQAVSQMLQRIRDAGECGRRVRITTRRAGPTKRPRGGT